MNSKRAEQIRHVYHSTREVEPGRREAFLKEACAGDQSLFAEVVSLLAQDGNSEGFFEAPALEVVARELAEDEAQKRQQNLIGQTLSHYRIEEKIAQGGMGEVFLARDLSLNRKVALKLLPAGIQQDPGTHRRFLHEARSGGGLNNPYLCSIYEIGKFEGKEYIVMEYVEGQTLAEKLRRGRLPLSQALQIAVEMAEALQAAHFKGIIHRDLKPSNIMLTSSGHVKVMDFGLAKRVSPATDGESQEESLSSMTERGVTLGTVAYMSPEQVKGEAVDPQRFEVVEQLRNAFRPMGGLQLALVDACVRETYSQAGIVQSDRTTWSRPAPRFWRSAQK